MIGRAMETAASFEARFAPSPYPATHVRSLGLKWLSGACLSKYLHEKAPHHRSLDDSDDRAIPMAVRDCSRKFEVGVPNEFFLVAFQPNSGSAEAVRVSANVRAVIGDQVMPIGLEVVVVKPNLVFRRKRQHRSSKDCGPDSQVGFVPLRADRSSIDDDAVVGRQTATINVLAWRWIKLILLRFDKVNAWEFGDVNGNNREVSHLQR